MEYKAPVTGAKLQSVCLRINGDAGEKCPPFIVFALENEGCFDPVFHYGGEGCNCHGYLASVHVDGVSAVIGVVLVVVDGSHAFSGKILIDNALSKLNQRCSSCSKTFFKIEMSYEFLSPKFLIYGQRLEKIKGCYV